MKLEKIIIEIDKRIIELESKKKQLNIIEMDIAKRIKLETEYNAELDKLAILKHYSK
jgi:ribosomal protein L30E